MPSLWITADVRGAIRKLTAAQRRIERRRVGLMLSRALSDANWIETPIITGRLRRSLRRFLAGPGREAVVIGKWVAPYAPIVFARHKTLSQRLIRRTKMLFTTRWNAQRHVIH